MFLMVSIRNIYEEFFKETQGKIITLLVPRKVLLFRNDSCFGSDETMELGLERNA